MCFSPLGRKSSELEGEVLVGSFPGIYVIGNEIKSTKVGRFNLAAEFRETTVKKLFIFFTVSNFLQSLFIIYFFSLFFSVKKAFKKTITICSKKKVNFFFNDFFSSAIKSCFITRAPPVLAREQKNSGKSFSFFYRT
jgi:hypothetical protein